MTESCQDNSQLLVSPPPIRQIPLAGYSPEVEVCLSPMVLPAGWHHELHIPRASRNGGCLDTPRRNSWLSECRNNISFRRSPTSDICGYVRGRCSHIPHQRH